LFHFVGCNSEDSFIGIQSLEISFQNLFWQEALTFGSVFSEIVEVHFKKDILKWCGMWELYFEFMSWET